MNCIFSEKMIALDYPNSPGASVVFRYDVGDKLIGITRGGKAISGIVSVRCVNFQSKKMFYALTHLEYRQKNFLSEDNVCLYNDVEMAKINELTDKIDTSQEGIREFISHQSGLMSNIKQIISEQSEQEVENS